MLASIYKLFAGVESDRTDDEAEFDRGIPVMPLEEALSIARSIAAEEGWSGLTPISAELTTAKGGRRVWSFVFQLAFAPEVYATGCTAYAVIDAKTGEVIQRLFHPR